ncbi:ATP-binding protein [Rhizobiaceae bacterium n13]|uniref:histidine kinase n=1 Tax=Ferirhizobium litorale TaxID=2927786 RepID=A0AAE3U3C1_9HYPH|nr:ATP-binding protein [Fererhizobium litorale]MDI7864735.1 ATP-binding protein [Fererhizobium litorale]MDI7924984.1 ATP-binding protein [Fererhizobium litorale]
MSYRANVQQRLSAARGEGTAANRARARESRTEPDTTGIAVPPSLENDAVANARLAARKLGRLWLGGGGLIAVTAILLIGRHDAFYAATLAVATFCTVCAVIRVLERLDDRSEQREFPNESVSEAEDSARLLSTIHDALGDIALTRTMDRRIVQANAIFREMTGCQVPHGLTCEEIGLAFRPGPVPHNFDVEIATPLGQRIFVWHDIITRDPATGRLLLQSIGRDVTDERQKSRAREEARLKAEGTSAAKSRLLATVSHEVRTPLSGILGMSHLLGQTRLTPEQKNYLDGIRQSGNALVQLVEDLLDFSTMEVGRFQLRPRAESLRNLLESVVEMLAHRGHEKGIEIGATFAADLPDLMNFDAARLRQVLFNVIGNAVKFTIKGGVLIAADWQEGDIIISVTDTGPGMTATERARIFGEFEQAGNDHDRSAGTGLGLAISARIMREFGGSLTVSSVKGKGSIFTVRFPAAATHAARRRNTRNTILKDSIVMVLAPEGPARTATAATISTLGGQCYCVDDENAAAVLFDTAAGQGWRFSDIIVDHRMTFQFAEDIAQRPDVVSPSLRKVFLVNPEERNLQPQDVFDAWLIRPLREQSLIDVLRGRMRGMEKRDALNDNQPGVGLSLADAAGAPGLDILLAEDDPVNAMLIKAMLVGAGHHVRSVADFEALLDAVWNGQTRRPDIVLSDLNMPGGEGLDVLTRIRAHERQEGLAPLPIIVLTADYREDVRRSVLMSGANLALPKPVDPDRLLADIGALAPCRDGDLGAQ